MDPQWSAALTLAERGWYVFPLIPGGKRPALHGTDNCLRTGACADGHLGWEQRATNDTDRVYACWERGRYNIGIATGPSGLVVVDLDTPKTPCRVPDKMRTAGVYSGEDMLAVLCEQAGQPLPFDTYTVRTVSGGRHLYFTAPEGVPLRNTAGKLGWLIDTRAHGGYVVAAPSVVRSREYTVEYDRPPAPLPAWLTDALQPAPLPPQQPVTVELGTGRAAAYLTAALSRNLAAVQNAPARQRNKALYGAAVALGQLIAGGALTEADVTPALTVAALAVGQTEAETARTIRSGYRAGANRPRSVAA
jgi:hypothetical protein